VTMGEIQNQGEVVVEIDGSPILGKYSIRGGNITVTTVHRRKTSVIGSLPPAHLARIIVRDLAHDAKA
jgi:hypothetical protein